MDVGRPPRSAESALKRRAFDATWSTPVKKARSEMRTVRSADNWTGVKARGRLLTRSSVTSSDLPSTPSHGGRKHLPTQKAFHHYSQLYWVGIRAPWTEQPCPLCNIKLMSIGSAASHMVRVHRAHNIEYYCKKCACKKPNLRSASIHGGFCGRKSRITNIAEAHGCSLCSKTFSSVRGRSLHIRRAHSALGSPTQEESPSFNLISPPNTRNERVKGNMDIDLKKRCELSYSKKKRRPRILSSTVRRADAKKNTFRMLQTLYRKDRAAAATLVLDRLEKVPCVIPLQEVERTYKLIWEGTDSYIGLGKFTDLPQSDNDVLIWPLAPQEVLSSMSRMKRSSAPGPDGVCLSSLLSWDPTGCKLTRLYNTMLYSGKTPSCLKESRTTLIPKMSGEGLLKVENWRPITISSSILRILSNTLSKRLSEACSLHRAQKGFVDGKGCAENLIILQGILSDAKRSTGSLSVIFIDLARAFDSVSHQLIEEVLKGREVDPAWVGFIKNTYKNAKTKVRTAMGETGNVRILRGVKQGDPLSPLLFNLAIDPVLHSLDRNGNGYVLAGQTITAMAYADDLLLVSKSWRGMKRNLKVLQEFLVATGLNVNIAKCGGFCFERKGSSRTLNNCKPWKLNGDTILMLGVNDSIKYLGVKVSPVGGIPPEQEEMLTKLLDNISEAPLKPTQRLIILSTYALPRVTYEADVGGTQGSALKRADALIRKYVKDWFHLDPSTADGLLYSRQRDGGLGILVIDQAYLNKLFRRVLGESERKSKTVWNPESMGVENLKSVIWRTQEFDRWNDVISNQWLRLPTSLREPEFMLALKVRSNTVMSRSASGGRADDGLDCRLCGVTTETLGHVVSCCEGLQHNRMKSHNKICRLLAELAASKGWSVERERRLFKANGGKGVPDIILNKNKESLVVDVALCYDSSDAYMSRMERRKIDKYHPLEEAVKQTFRTEKVEFFGFPMGVKGKWHKPNSNLLRRMGFSQAETKRLARMITRRTLLQSLDIIRTFRSLVRLK
uniref:ribonuclease H n=1 Tax=Fundulus heteroclitus TaxID=8078 RepID=A0A3Q2NSF9_FUNHE